MAVSMLQSAGSLSTKAFGSRPAAKQAKAVRGASNVVLAAHKADEGLTRREATAAGLLAVATVLNASPAMAGIFGDGGEAKYVEETTNIIATVNKALATPLDDAEYDNNVKAVRRETNDWVASYRRDKKFAGRPSFGNVYSALNALSGHYNNFGTQSPIPKKRLERINKELEDGLRLVGRGR